MRATNKLVEENHGTREELFDFFESTILWDSHRVRHIIHGFDKEVTWVTKYVLGRFFADPDPKPINEYFYAEPTLFKYELTEEQKEYVQRNLFLYGDNPSGIGRLMAKAFVKKLLRTPNGIVDKKIIVC